MWSGMGRLDPVGVVPGRNLLVSRFEGPATAPDLMLFDRKLTPVRRLSNAEPRLEGIRVGSVERFETVIGGADGKLLTVQSRVLLPFGAKREDHLPTVVYFYSGAPLAFYAHDYGGGAPSSIPMQIFTSRGYAVLLCDVPLGPMGKPGNPVQEMTDAILAQVRHAADLGYTDIGRVAIMGHSYGGYSTAAIITRTNLFRAAMALDGMYDLGSTYGAGGEADVAWAEGGQGRMGTHPWADVDRYVANSPYYQADKIHTPLLLIHGDKDGACPVVEARKMFNALKRLDRDAELAVYEGEGHVTGRWALPNAVDAAQRMLDFLATHLKE
jgi:dipeptidyl aminopeptidase/acylaminoacyl peptidase